MKEAILEDAGQVSNDALNQQGESTLSDDGRNIALALSLASRDASIRNTPEMAELMGLIDGNGTPARNGAPATPATPATPGAPAQDTAGQDGASIFFAKPNAPAPSQYNLETTEGIQKYVKDNYNADNVNTFFTQVKSWAGLDEKVKSLEKQNSEVQDFLINLPDPLYEAVEAFYYNRDWKEAISKINKKVDFSKPYDQNSERHIVEHYFPGQFSDEDFSEGDSVVLKKAQEIAKKSFAVEHQREIEERSSMQQDMVNKTKMVESSIEKSVASLKKAFPEMNDAAISRIQKSMVTGDYRTMFFNEDGTFTEDAAKAIALAMFGDQEIKKIAESKANKNANRQVHDIVSRGADRPPRQNAKPAADSQDNTFMKFIGGYLPENSTYSAKTAPKQ